MTAALTLRLRWTARLRRYAYPVLLERLAGEVCRRLQLGRTELEALDVELCAPMRTRCAAVLEVRAYVR